MMEENVALVAENQNKFQKSIKGIKKLIKSGKIKTVKDKNKASVKRPSALQGVKKKKSKKEKGLVYISHIPHGFYENEMTQYFKQFGGVTNARVIRSKRTGQSKGCAFVEFAEPAVAEIVADTMNNYLMGKRLLKAAYVPPEKQRTNALRKNWNNFENPGSVSRRKIKKAYNANLTEEADLGKARKILKNLSQTKKKLKEMGIDYDFFKPVDVPEVLLASLEKIDADNKDTVKKENKVDKKSVKLDQVSDKNDEKQKKKSKLNQDVQTKTIQKSKKNVENVQNKSIPATENIKGKEKSKQKKNKLNVSKSEDYITVPKTRASAAGKLKQKQPVDTDDSADEFNSDEFEMVLESDDEDGLSEESDAVENSVLDDSTSEEEEAPVEKPKNKKGKKPQAAVPQILKTNKRKKPLVAVSPPKKQKVAQKAQKQQKKKAKKN